MEEDGRDPGHWGRASSFAAESMGILGSLGVSPPASWRRPQHAASCSRAHGEMADLLGFMGSLGVWEFDHSPGRAGRPAASYPQVINKFIVFREFGSLKLLDTDRGPRAFLRTTRALGPRPFGPVP